MPPSLMRTEIEKVDGVGRCWIEREYDPMVLKEHVVLVVEVKTTDEAEGFNFGILEQIREAIGTSINSGTGTQYDTLRLVPSSR